MAVGASLCRVGAQLPFARVVATETLDQFCAPGHRGEGSFTRGVPVPAPRPWREPASPVAANKRAQPVRALITSPRLPS